MSGGHEALKHVHQRALFRFIWPWVAELMAQFGVDEHPVATYFDVHQGYRVLTHSRIQGTLSCWFGGLDLALNGSLVLEGR